MWSLFEKDEICNCGKPHISSIKNVLTGSGTIKFLAEEATKLNIKKAFVLADENTYEVAGKTATKILSDAGILYTKHVFGMERLAPDEKTLGMAIMQFDTSCDGIIAIGSGVINDIGKILSNITGKPYIIVATAPSMDGYASQTSSMERGGLKVSINSRCPDVIIGDTDVLKNAPLHMMKSGIGDMIAKYVSICEWRIGNVILGEYYCENIASLIRSALKKCVDNAENLLRRDEKAVEAVFEGLVIGGVAMAYAGVSRPASGGEHYMSHIWDMRGLEFGLSTELHGIQCAYATYLTICIYERIKKIMPDKEKALKYAMEFDFGKWSDELRLFLGKGAEQMIAQEEHEGKYNIEKHKDRLNVIIENWNKIVEIINEELPDMEFIDKLFKQIELPDSCEKTGVERELLPMSFKSSKDIREKYVLPRLVWDLGIMDEVCSFINNI